MEGRVLEGAEIAQEEIVVEVQIIGVELVGSVSLAAGDVVSGCDEGLDGAIGTPRMASWV